MELQDIPAVLNIERRLHDFPWEAKIFEDGLDVGFDCWVLVQRQDLFGYLVIHIHYHEAHILNLAVDTPWQGQGYGKQLVEKSLERAKALGCSEVTLEVAVSNQAAIGLYLEYGFKKFATKKSYYERPNGNFEDAWVMVKHL